MIYELFEKEGLLDDYEKLSDKNLVHAEDFLKRPRDSEIEQNTFVFGTVNRLHLIKNKMKNNTSFQENVTCVDTKGLLSWVGERRVEYDAAPDAPEDEDAATEEFADEEADDVSVEVADHEIFDEPNEEVIEEGETAEESNEAVAEEVSEDAVNEEATGDGKFKFEYLAQSVAISAIAEGFSVHDYNPKELAYAFISKLNTG